MKNYFNKSKIAKGVFDYLLWIQGIREWIFVKIQSTIKKQFLNG